MKNIVAQSAIAFHVSIDIGKISRNIVEKTRMLVGGLAFIWGIIAAFWGYKNIKQRRKQKQ